MGFILVSGSPWHRSLKPLLVDVEHDPLGTPVLKSVNVFHIA
jgi:hypothetical protein